MKKDVSPENTVFYSTANAGYAVYAAVSLLTVRDHIPDAKLYLLSSGLSDNDKKILDENKIIYHELNLKSAFTKTWDYPIDCYYIFAGPEFFAKQGYDYSVYIDGDVLCVSNPLEELPIIGCVAGVESAGEKGDYSGIFGDDWDKIKKIWSLPQKTATRKRINAGVVYFNNQKMEEMGLLNIATNLFRKSLGHGIPRKGDDSLFSLLQYVELQENDVIVLPARYNYILQYNKWSYPVDNLVFFHFSLDKPWKTLPYKHSDPSLNMFNPLVKDWRKKYRRVSLAGYLNSKGKIFSRINYGISFIVKILFRVKSNLNDILLWVLGYKKSFLMRRRNIRKDPVKLYWWSDYINGIANFGDEMTKDLLLKIFGYRSIFAAPDEAELVGAGSILEIVSEQHGSNSPYIWGSGFMWEKSKNNLNTDGLNFCAVRGVKSKNRLGENGSDITLGDPGLLAGIAYKRSRYHSDKIGVIAHFVDAEEKIIQKMKTDPRFIIIDPLASPEEVVLKITSCKLILSSSLHGIIFADSFGVPNAHIQISNKVAGGSYKFDDYYSATDRIHQAANIKKVFDDTYLDELISLYQPVHNLKKIQKNLVKSLPKLR